jgi:hypothetical protein
MADVPQEEHRRWFRLTPDRLVIGLLAVEGLLLLCDWFGCFAKGWAVVTAVATIGAAMLLMGLWFIVSLVLRRRFQFCIRSLLLLTAAVAIACSWLKVVRQQMWGRLREQQDAWEKIEKAGGRVTPCYINVASGYYFPCGARSEPHWLSELLPDLFGKVVIVRLDCSDASDAGLEHLKELPDLDTLYLSGAKVSDAALEHLKGLTQLETLNLSGTKISKAGIRELRKALPNAHITGP